MTNQAPLLSMGAARKLAQAHVGLRMQLTPCRERPTGIYAVEYRPTFYFVAIDPRANRIGGTLHVSVDRRSGCVEEFMVGE